MSAFFVTRHKGAIEWARRQGITAAHVAHLELSLLQPGDDVLGTLPVSIAADLNAMGVRYHHLDLRMPESARGGELTADDMERCGARLTEYRVVQVKA
jgi:CRISPR-associated protein Csx16